MIFPHEPNERLMNDKPYPTHVELERIGELVMAIAATSRAMGHVSPAGTAHDYIGFDEDRPWMEHFVRDLFCICAAWDHDGSVEDARIDEVLDRFHMGTHIAEGASRIG